MIVRILLGILIGGSAGFAISLEALEAPEPSLVTPTSPLLWVLWWG